MTACFSPRRPAPPFRFPTRTRRTDAFSLWVFFLPAKTLFFFFFSLCLAYFSKEKMKTGFFFLASEIFFGVFSPWL